jgi:nucleotide-binding universal stress UspA family protein
VSYSIALAAYTGAELHFLRVVSLPLITGTPDTVAGSSFVVESVVEHSAVTLSWVAEAAEQADVPYTTTMRWGRVAQTILWTAEEEDCDLIVLGAHARPRWQQPLRGYVARQVAASARRPVLVIQQQSPVACEPVYWSRALVVTDATPDTSLTLEHAFALAQAEDLDVRLLHVKAAWPPGSARQAERTAKEICTLAAAQAAATGVRYAVRVATGPAAPAILQAAAEHQCDVIILGMHENTYWQQFRRSHLIREVTTKASCPVLLVPSSFDLQVPVER